MDTQKSPGSKFQRTKKIFNSTDYMRKSKTLLGSYKESDSLLTHTSQHQSVSRPSIVFPIADLFHTSIPEQHTCRPIKTKKLSILSNFGLIPQEKFPIKDLKSPQMTQRTIQISDFIGKGNKRKIFKSLDLRENFWKEGKKEKKANFGKIDLKNKMLKGTSCGRLADICRNIDMLNGYQQREKYSSKLGKIEQIYKSCDSLLKDSKAASKTLKHYTIDLK